jgi:hypothetical protein
MLIKSLLIMGTICGLVYGCEGPILLDRALQINHHPTTQYDYEIKVGN